MRRNLVIQSALQPQYYNVMQYFNKPNMCACLRGRKCAYRQTLTGHEYVCKFNLFDKLKYVNVDDNRFTY